MDLKAVLNLVRKPANTRDDIAAALEALDVAGAERRADDLEAKRRRILISGSDQDLAAIEQKIAAANREIERTIAMREELESRLARLDLEDEEQQRLKAYQHAHAEQSRAEKALRRYSGLARQIVDLLAEIAKAEAAIDAANADLPMGVAPITGAELSVRGLPAEYREISGEEKFSQWHFEGANSVPAELAKKVISVDGQSGRLEISRDGALKTFRVEKRHFIRQRYLEGRAPFEPQALASTIVLPGLLPGSSDFWYPVDTGASLLSHIEEMNTDWSVPLKDPRPPRATRQRIVPANEPSQD